METAYDFIPWTSKIDKVTAQRDLDGWTLVAVTSNVRGQYLYWNRTKVYS